MSAYRVIRKISRSLRNDLALKVVSIFVAIFLFAIVRGAQDAQRTFFVELTPLLPPEQSGQVLVSQVPQEVRVTLKGSESVLRTIQRDGIPAVHVDLRTTTGRYFYFDPSLFDLPPGVSVVQVFPASLRLSYAKRFEKRLEVAPRLVGESRRGLSVFTPLRLEPSQVRIRGPEARVNAIGVIHTEPIDIASLDVGVHKLDVPLEPLPEFVSYLDEPTVSIEIEIVPEVRERRLRRLNVAIVGASARVRPTKVNIILRGQPPALDGIEPEDIIPYVEVSGMSLIKGGAQPVAVKVRGVPLGVKVLAVEPPDVLVSPKP